MASNTQRTPSTKKSVTKAAPTPSVATSSQKGARASVNKTREAKVAVAVPPAQPVKTKADVKKPPSPKEAPQRATLAQKDTTKPTKAKAAAPKQLTGKAQPKAKATVAATATKATATATTAIAPARKAADKIAVTPAVKAKRARVPADLAARYGENIKERKVALPSAKERKARKTAEERERIRQLMQPDDGILKRLARAGLVATAVGDDVPGLRPKSTAKRRSRKWETRCGKCGVVTTFSTQAGLCTRCGAIAVRVVD